MYFFSTAAVHAPHHVWPEWVERFEGRFDEGWDALREEIFERQLELGVIPADTELTPRPEQIPAWADYPDRFVLGSDTWAPTRWTGVEPLASDARAFLAELPGDVARRIAWDNGIAQHKTHIFNRVVKINLQVAFGFYAQIKKAMDG